MSWTNPLPAPQRHGGSQQRPDAERAHARWLAAAENLERAMRAHAVALKGGFDPNQRRDDRGRWTDTGSGGAGDASTEIGAARKRPPIVQEFGKWTARQFVSRYCEARVNRELPREFEDVTIVDIWNIARGGDARARTCMKLLNSGQFRKQ